MIIHYEDSFHKPWSQPFNIMRDVPPSPGTDPYITALTDLTPEEVEFLRGLGVKGIIDTFEPLGFIAADMSRKELAEVMEAIRKRWEPRRREATDVWEYETVDFAKGSIVVRKRYLDQLGKEGWELVSVDGGIAYLKHRR